MYLVILNLLSKIFGNLFGFIINLILNFFKESINWSVFWFILVPNSVRESSFKISQDSIKFLSFFYKFVCIHFLNLSIIVFIDHLISVNN